MAADTNCQLAAVREGEVGEEGGDSEEGEEGGDSGKDSGEDSGEDTYIENVFEELDAPEDRAAFRMACRYCRSCFG